MGRMYLLSYLLVAVLQSIVSGRPADNIENHHNITQDVLQAALNYVDSSSSEDSEYNESDESPASPTTTNGTSTKMTRSVGGIPSALTRNSSNINIGDATVGENGEVPLKDISTRGRAAVMQNIASERPAGDIESHHNIKRRDLLQDFLSYIAGYDSDYYEYYDTTEEEKKPGDCGSCNILITVGSLPGPPTITTPEISSTTITTTAPTIPTITTLPTTTVATSIKMTRSANVIPSALTQNSSNINIGDVIVGERGQITLKDLLARKRAMESESDSDDYDDMKAAMEAFLGITPASPVVNLGVAGFTEESKAGKGNSGSKPASGQQVSGPDIFERDVEAAMQRQIVKERLAFNERNGIINKNNKGLAMDLEAPFVDAEGPGEVERNQEAGKLTGGSFIRLGEADVVEGVQKPALANPTIRGVNDKTVERAQEAPITAKDTTAATAEANMVKRNPEPTMTEANTMVVEGNVIKGNQEAELNGGNTGIQKSPVITKGNDEIAQTDRKGPVVHTEQAGVVQSDQKTSLDAENTMNKTPERAQGTTTTTGGPSVVAEGKQEAAINGANTQEESVAGGRNAEVAENDQNAKMDAKTEIETDIIVDAEDNKKAGNGEGAVMK